MTAAGAYASFDEARKGRLQPGQLADIVILTKDVFAQPPARFLDAVVDVTILGGKVVYRGRFWLLAPSPDAPRYLTTRSTL